MAQATAQRRPVWTVVALAVLLAVATMLTQSCSGGKRPNQDAEERIESIEEIPVDALWESREFRGYLYSIEPPMTLGKFVHLGCTQIIDDDAQHLIYTQDADCPSIVLGDAMGYDLVISYNDAFCTNEPALDVQWVEGQLHFTIDKAKDRGECDDIAIPHLKGIRLEKQTSGSPSAVRRR